jgi:hypothetical protein
MATQSFFTGIDPGKKIVKEPVRFENIACEMGAFT